MITLKEQHTELSAKIFATAHTLKQTLSVLMSDINLIGNKADFFTFNDKNKKATSEHLHALFSSNETQTTSVMLNLSSKAAKLASLLIAADRAMNVELIILCEKQFNAYEKFEKEYYEYVASIENEFENSVLSVNFLSRAIKKLELQIDEFIGEFAS